MCGIAGIYHFDPNIQVNEIVLKRMTQSMIHRGPDEEGYHLEKNIGLGHRRLSIIDIENGQQPMFSNDGGLILIYNGEIYNYLELRSELIKFGYVFKTKCDTEVLLYAYDKWGVDCLSKLNGMWAFAILDKRKNELVLARDRMGVKPLYYFLDDKTFAFSSELKGFYHDFNLEKDNGELWDALVFGPKPGGKTYFKNVFELHPGSYLIISLNSKNIRTGEYYKLEDTLIEESSEIDYEYIEYLINDAVKIRLVSEVPLGSLNSGGIDSSLMSAIANHFVEENQLNTFSIAPEKQNGTVLPGDESYYAELLGKFIKSNHHTIRYNENDFFGLIESSQFYNDGILFHSNSIPQQILFQHIKEDFGITVLLSGEGADEVFRGYGNNKFVNFYNLISLFPFTKNIGEKIITKNLNKFDDPVFKEYPFLLKLTLLHNAHLRSEIVNTIMGINGCISDDRIHLLNKTKRLSMSNKVIFYEQKCYLSGLLQRVDRMSMRYSIEVRVPFLDYRIVNELNKIKFSLKSGINEKKIKKILKRISLNYLPKEIINRRKMGFCSPLNVYKHTMIKEIKKFDRHNNFVNQTGEEIFILLNYYLLNENQGKSLDLFYSN
jgi:asparagine synthase (glutamine-hydrolysing)